jgi:hypothetical protein
MRKLFCLLISATLIWTNAGCAMLVATPQVARFQIKGPNHQIKEFVISLDHWKGRESDTDIALSKRYAIQFQLQWLWYEQADLPMGLMEDDEMFRSPMTPLIIGKCRF